VFTVSREAGGARWSGSLNGTPTTPSASEVPFKESGKMRLGFDFVPFPRDIWSDGIELSQSEFRLLGWFLFNLQFGIKQMDATDDNILRGVKKNGKNYPAVGLSRNSMQKARDSLVEKNMLIATQLSDGGGRGKAAAWHYSVNLSEVDNNEPETSQELTINLAEPERIVERNLSKVDIAIKEVREEQRSTEKSSVRPSLEEVLEYCRERKNHVDPEKWFDYYSANGWKVGRNAMKDWKAAVRTWERNGFSNGNGNHRAPSADPVIDPIASLHADNIAYDVKKNRYFIYCDPNRLCESCARVKRKHPDAITPTQERQREKERAAAS
jgi:hypothetical protein